VGFWGVEAAPPACARARSLTPPPALFSIPSSWLRHQAAGGRTFFMPRSRSAFFQPQSLWAPPRTPPPAPPTGGAGRSRGGPTNHQKAKNSLFDFFFSPFFPRATTARENKTARVPARLVDAKRCAGRRAEERAGARAVAVARKKGTRPSSIATVTVERRTSHPVPPFNKRTLSAVARPARM